MSESDDDTIRNLRGPDDPLVGALRQYRHNVGDGFVAAYDKAETEHYVAVLRATIAELESERDDLQADLYEATNDQ